MSTARETLKMFEDLERQLTEIQEREEKVKRDQRMVNTAQANVDKQLSQVRELQYKAEQAMGEFRAESARKDDEYRHRETVIAGKASDLDRKIAEHERLSKTRENDIEKRLLALEKRESACLEKERSLSRLSSEYTRLSDQINKVLQQSNGVLSK